MAMYIVVKPFNARLNSKKAIQLHYNEGKDFIIQSLAHGPGRHINKQDVERLGNIKLEVRYGQYDEKLTII